LAGTPVAPGRDRFNTPSIGGITFHVYGYPEFNDEFLQCMKDEIPLVSKLVTEIKYNFEGDDAAKEAKTYMNRIKDRAQAAPKRHTA